MLSIAPGQHGYLDVQDLQKALSLLSPEQREALVLVTAAGLSYGEAAKVTQCPVGTMKGRANRARAKLTQMLCITDQDIFGPDHITKAIVKRLSGRQRAVSSYS